MEVGPSPGRVDHGVDVRPPGREPQLPHGQAGVGHQLGRVARPTGRVADRHRPTGHPAHRVDDLLDREAATGPQVECRGHASPLEVSQGADVGVGQIADVDVVADRRSVRGRIIPAHQIERRNLPLHRHQRPRNQVGFRLVHLADPGGRVGAAGVEIAQADRGHSVRRGIVAQSLLDHQLGAAIRIDRGLRGRLGDRLALGHAVDGRRA